MDTNSNYLLELELTSIDEDEKAGIEGIEIVAATENKRYYRYEIFLQIIILIVSFINLFRYA
jgi:hypothetical protein